MRIFSRGLLYEAIAFLLATFITWLVIGNPWTSLFLTILITAIKVPLYLLFHWTMEENAMKHIRISVFNLWTLCGLRGFHFTPFHFSYAFFPKTQKRKFVLILEVLNFQFMIRVFK